MNREAVKPIREFMESSPKPGAYFLNTQFGKINYLSGEISATISTRLNASGKDFIIEVK